MTAECNLLFVYGTLRKGFDHPMADYLAARARHLGGGKVPGQLYDLGAYPGLLDAAGPEEWVYGDLYELREPAETLAALDRYEGRALPDAPPLFERRMIPVTIDTG